MSGRLPDIENLTDQQRSWVLHSEARWREAHSIAAANPWMDPGNVYHALRCLEFPPAQRLGRGLTRVRNRPALGGEGLDRVYVVLTASGLESFESEFARARDYDLDGVPVKVLPLERVIVSKRAAKRPKDTAQIPDARSGAGRSEGQEGRLRSSRVTRERKLNRGDGNHGKDDDSPDGRLRPAARVTNCTPSTIRPTRICARRRSFWPSRGSNPCRERRWRLSLLSSSPARLLRSRARRALPPHAPRPARTSTSVT